MLVAWTSLTVVKALLSWPFSHKIRGVKNQFHLVMNIQIRHGNLPKLTLHRALLR